MVASQAALRRPLMTQPSVSGQAASDKRDAAWFSALYEETFESVYRYAIVLVGDKDQAEDLAAEVYLRAWRGRSQFRGDARPLSWLLSIAHNTGLSSLRKNTEVVDVGVVSDREDAEVDPVEQLIASADVALVQAAMQQLTVEQQQVLFLRFFEGLPHQEVANRLGKKPNAVRALQFRALARLKHLLEDRLEQPA